MKLSDLTCHLDQYLDISSFADPSFNGLQVENSGSVTKVGLAVDACLETILKATEASWAPTVRTYHSGGNNGRRSGCSVWSNVFTRTTGTQANACTARSPGNSPSIQNIQGNPMDPRCPYLSMGISGCTTVTADENSLHSRYSPTAPEYQSSGRGCSSTCR